MDNQTSNENRKIIFDYFVPLQSKGKGNNNVTYFFISTSTSGERGVTAYLKKRDDMNLDFDDLQWSPPSH